jgi:hypothetical protein
MCPDQARTLYIWQQQDNINIVLSVNERLHTDHVMQVETLKPVEAVNTLIGTERTFSALVKADVKWMALLTEIVYSRRLALSRFKFKLASKGCIRSPDEGNLSDTVYFAPHGRLLLLK